MSKRAKRRPAATTKQQSDAERLAERWLILDDATRELVRVLGKVDFAPRDLENIFELEMATMHVAACAGIVRKLARKAGPVTKR
jgi:hypothetical protein